MSRMRAVAGTLRFMNQRALLEHLFRAGPATRAGLADITGMSPPTVGKIIDELLGAGVLQEAPAVNDGRQGRPGRLVMLERHTPRFLLVQVGVRTTDVAAVPVAGDGDDPWQESFATAGSERAWLAGLKAALRKLPATRGGNLWAVAISLPGIVDDARGECLLSPNLHWTERAAVLPHVAELVGAPACVVQENRALALGHAAATGERDFLLVECEDGVGGAVMIKGRLLEGASAAVGEIGHTPVIGNRAQCGCGGRGCLETLVSRPALLARFAAGPRAAAKNSRAGWPDFLDAVGRRADPPAWLLDRLDATAMVVGSALNACGLARVVLTGAVAELPGAALDRLRAQIREASLAARLGQVEVEVAPGRRARGMLASLIARLLIPTTDWAQPCRIESQSEGSAALTL
jgi:predicted NBD/HSP70 family sugar kinase